MYSIYILLLITNFIMDSNIKTERDYVDIFSIKAIVIAVIVSSLIVSIIAGFSISSLIAVAIPLSIYYFLIKLSLKLTHFVNVKYEVAGIFTVNGLVFSDHITGVSISFFSLVLHIFIIVYMAQLLIRVVISNSRNEYPESIVSKMVFIVFAFSYWYISLANLTDFVRSIDSNAFSGIKSYGDSLYYTLITFATIGYGDIQPIDGYGKLVASIISLGSMFFLIIFISTYMSNPHDRHPEETLYTDSHGNIFRIRH